MKLFPSILSSDFACPERDLQAVAEGGITRFHLDVMDGHFVPNLSFGIPVIRSLVNRFPDYRWDSHLMIENPEDFVGEFLELGTDWLSVHVEVDPDMQFLRRKTLEAGVELGIALNPNTDLGDVTPHLDKVDFVLAMTVQPGYGGQSFREDVLPKIRRLNKQFEGPIQVDGGVGPETIEKAADAGADWFVSGSSVFGQPDPGRAARELENRVR